MTVKLAVAAIICIVALAALTACGGDDPAPAPPATAIPATATASPTATAVATAEPVTTTATATPEPTPSPAPEPSPAPTPTPAPEPLTFRYSALDLTGSVAEPGSYAFLTADGTPVATYEGLRDGSVAALRIHETDADGVSRAAFFDGVTAGNMFEWRERETCWVRYIVDETPTPVAGARTIAIRWLAYAYAGCSGDLATDGSWTHRWSPPNLSHPDFTTAIRFGPFFLYQPGWDGEYPGYERTAALYGEPGEEREGRILSNDLATVRQHPLWREPDVPDGWTLTEATAGMDGQYGYWAHYAPTGGGYGVNVVIRYIDYLPIWEPSGSTASSLTQEMRLIDGRPAIVEYSPEGSGNPSSPYVAIYDEATGILYEAFAQELSLRRAGAEGAIAILRSLIPPPGTFRYDFLDRSGEVSEPGSYAFLTADGTVVTTYEEMRDGSTVALLIHRADADGVPQDDFYDNVAAGDVFEWREHETCWIRYIVDEVSPDPTGAGTRVLLAIRWITYAYTGCSGAILAPPSSPRSFQWSPSSVQSPNVTSPVRHGPYTLIPVSYWDSDLLEEVVWIGPPRDRPDPDAAMFLPYTDDPVDVVKVKQHRLWRDPAIPQNWEINSADANWKVRFGYTVVYSDGEGYFAVSISVRRRDWIPEHRAASAEPGVAVEDHRVIYEARLIDGHSAIVRYSPSGNLYTVTEVYIFDGSTSLEYVVVGLEPGLRHNIDATIAVARSLYEPGWVGSARGDVAAVLGAGDRDAAGEALRRSETPFSDEARAYLLELNAALNARTSPDEREIAVEMVDFSDLGSREEGRAVILTVGAASGGLPLPSGGGAAGALALCLVEEGGAVEVRLPAPLSACRVE